MQVLTTQQTLTVAGGNSINDVPNLMPLSSASQYCPAPRPFEREPGLGEVFPGLVTDGAALLITAVGSYLESTKKSNNGK